MYRGLNDFLSSDTTYDNHVLPSSLCSLHENIHCSSHEPPHDGDRRTSTGALGTPVVPVQLNGIGVDVHTSHSYSLPVMSQAIRHSANNDPDRQLQAKPRELV